MHRALLIALGLTLATPALAELPAFETGNSLLQRCTDPVGSAQACMAYTGAIADAMSGHDLVHGLRACVPVGITRGKVVDIVKAYLVAHPELRHYAASVLAARAFQEAWPCPQ
jgi:hypothetical protein